jgi:hypothetical protein
MQSSDSERTLGNLHVLGALSQNDKLMTNEDFFDIYAPTTWRAVLRTWYGERRAQNVARIKHAVRAGITFASKSLEDTNALLDALSDAAKPPVGGDAMRLRIATGEVQHHRMLEALKRARGGLGNLLQTYRDDAALVSQLSLIIAEIEDFCGVIAPLSAALHERTPAVDVDGVSYQPPPAYALTS